MISVIVCSIHQPRFTHITEQFRRLLGDEPHEIIGIHDARSLAEGYNRGIDQSKGDILLFSHDDIDIWTDAFIPRLKKHLESADAVGVAGTNRLVGPAWYQAGPPHIFGQVAHPMHGEIQVHMYGAPARLVGGMQAMDGLFLAFRRSAIEKIRWDERTFDDFHGYDIDCTYRAFRAGLRLAVALDLPIIHHSHGAYGETWKRYAAALSEKHGPAFAALSPRKYQHTVIQVPTEHDAREIMDEVCRLLP